jgi:cytochrome P450
MGGIPGVFLAEGDDWRRQRRMVMPGLAPHAIKAYFPSLVRVALRLQRRWQQAMDAGATIDLSADLKRYTVDIIAGLAFGSDVNTIESGDDVIQKHLDVILPGLSRRSLSVFPYWRYIKLPADRRLEESVAAMRASVDELITQARMRMDAHPSLRTRPTNLLEAMIVAADEEDSGVDDTTVAGNVSTMLLAGEDTTANTLSWMLYLLHRHPEAMQRASEEVRRMSPDPASFNIEQMDALSYIGACAEEAMRLKPVAPYIPLEAVEDTVVADIRVPAGTVVWCVMRHDGVDERFFPDAASFKPERWLGDRPSGDKAVPMPFGAGPRTCPGRYLALLEIKIAMAMLLGGFEIEAIDAPDGKDAKEFMGFVMSPVGLTMHLRARGTPV